MAQNICAILRGTEMIFDTHSHYDDKAFDADREEMLSALPEHGIGAAVDVAATEESMEEVVAVAESHPHIFAAVGVHPSECGGMTEETMKKIRALLKRPKTVAVGEIGLDYHWDTPAREKQQKWFRAQLALAAECGAPVIIHSRDAASDTMEILKEFAGKNPGALPLGVIHCYSYSTEQAVEYIRMGFYIGVGGVVTFRNARRLKDVVREIPLDRIVLETDCPYLAPEPHRGERNSSLFLPYVVQAVAELKEIAPETVEEVTWSNAERMYRIRKMEDGSCGPHTAAER